MNNSEFGSSEIHYQPLIITSLIFGFLLIPFHEFGHVIFHWLTGNPEAMSYARDYLLGNGHHTFLGVLGGPILPLLLSVAAVILIFKPSGSLSILYPLAILGAFDRFVLYITMGLPSDEKDLSDFLHWNSLAFEHIFLAVEIILYALIIYSMFRKRIKIKMMILSFVIPLISFVLMTAFGILIIEKYVFPVQFHLQFG
jgi:hypothetical protein